MGLGCTLLCVLGVGRSEQNRTDGEGKVKWSTSQTDVVVFIRRSLTILVGSTRVLCNTVGAPLVYQRFISEFTTYEFVQFNVGFY